MNQNKAPQNEWEKAVQTMSGYISNKERSGVIMAAYSDKKSDAMYFNTIAKSKGIEAELIIAKLVNNAVKNVYPNDSEAQKNAYRHIFSACMDEVLS